MSSSEVAVNPKGDEACEIEDEEEKEVEQLEAEVNELAEKVIELRRTMKLVFRDKLESLLLSMRPTLPEDKPSSSVEGSKAKQGTETTLATTREEQEVDQETAAQIALLKSKIAANVAAMPATTERMKLCIEKIDRLDQYKVNIDYAFTKKLDSVKLLKDIFCEDHSFLSREEGTSLLKDHLERNNSFNFLIVLDDVDHVEQLDSLLVMDGLNKPGNNLVIITTREVGVLTSAGIDTGYHLKGLDREDGRELFCWHALGQPHPSSVYTDLVQEFINICGGLPLSLQVLGRDVFRRPLSYWQEVLKKARKILPGDIKQRLKISFDSLGNEEKQVFIDIACFFIDKSITTAMTIWKGSGWSGQHALETLKEKCLIEENVSYLPFLEWEVKWKSRQDEFAFRMHDHLRDLGRELANELNHPRRWWHPQLHLRSFESDGFKNILAQIKGRCFHSFMDESMHCQITYFLGQPEDSSDTCLLWLQLDYQNRPQLDMNSDINPSIPPWIHLQNLKCLRISGGRFQRLWLSDVQAPSRLKELQVRETFVKEFPDLLRKLNNVQEVEIIWKR